LQGFLHLYNWRKKVKAMPEAGMNIMYIGVKILCAEDDWRFKQKERFLLV
jgi:hypothetical protein